MTIKTSIKDFLTGSKRKKVINHLHQLIEVEQRYLLQDFGLEYLEHELGIEQDYLIELLQQEYRISFYLLLRNLRINHLKVLVSKYGEKLSLNDYAKFTGFKDVQIMLVDLTHETGLDFDDFCKYAQESVSRND